MGTKTVRFSDLTNKIIDDDGEVVRLVVDQHPALTDGPVEIEASKDEVEPIRNVALDVVSLKLYQGDGSPPETITMEIEAFNKLAGDMDIAEQLDRLVVLPSAAQKICAPGGEHGGVRGEAPVDQ